ncbi:fibronectin type III domain-containing protein [Dactylosporangium sp. CA-052675]|uniref:fibronectin type III domain-containing protein n=1 Tax=Dactylosporangium sp. CA-052675 TaxID=3239927 RepID=UPI003D8CBC13
MSSSAQLANALQGARAIASHGDKRGALALLDQALDAATTALGGDDPDVLAATAQLARYQVEVGELGDARRALEEGLAAGYHRLGDGHAVMLALAFELARVADELGNVFEAKRRYGQVARLGPQALGDGHPSVRAARQYLGLPDPEGTVHVPPPPVTFDPITPPPATFDPVTPPPATFDPITPRPRPPADDRPIFRPEPREDAFDEPDEYPDEDPGEYPDEDPGEDPDEDDYRPAPWQQTAPGVLQRTEYRPAPGYRPMPEPRWEKPPGPVRPEPPRQRRSPMVAIVVIAVIAVLGGAAAAAVAFLSAGGKDPGPAPTVAAPQPGGPASDEPSAAAIGSGRAPRELHLRDDRTSVTLTWQDPTKGTVPFIVAGGTEGAMRELQGLPAGTTKYTINGLNPKLEYCFTVAAVYGTQDVQLSDLACTKRK